jgi:BirA family biotin operon repressor/biotin-[acetyl-CoA-carboxylase] ligase
MLLARREADEGAPHGTLVLAEEQTAGRGRRGRSFHSPAGQNLYFTAILRPAPASAQLLTLAVPVAVAEACREQTGLDARIKWPNDIWVGDLKVCGMLIDAATGDDGQIVAMPGIGINVNGDPSRNPELAAIATSLARELGRPVDREALLARICNSLEQAIDAAGAEPGHLIERYRALSLILGRQVTIQAPDGPVQGIATAIGLDGSLTLLLDSGEARSFSAGDVSLRPASQR